MKIKSLVLCLVLAAFGVSWAFAQETNEGSKGKAATRTITGCLSSGENANEFLLTGNDGSTWEVRSSAVDLAEHVGQTVSATGVVSNAKMHNLKEDAKDAAHDTGIKKSNTEHGHMQITSVQTVSKSCSK